MTVIPTKYTTAELPKSKKEADVLAKDRESWARQARASDMPGSAREFELTALLLRWYIKEHF